MPNGRSGTEGFKSVSKSISLDETNSSNVRKAFGTTHVMVSALGSLQLSGCRSFSSPGGAIQPAMPRMSSDELLLRRFGQPRQASQPKEEEEEEEPGLDAQSARFGAYGTHKQASQQKRRRRSRGSMLQILSNSLETHRECYRSFQKWMRIWRSL